MKKDEKKTKQELIDELNELRRKEDSKNRFQRFFEMELVGMAIIEPWSKKWIEVNKGLCNMLGYTQEEIKEHTWETLTHPDDRKKDVNAYNKLLVGKIESYERDKRLIHKNGKTVYARTSVSCLRDEDEGVKYVFCTYQDVSQLKETEQDLKREKQQLYTLIDNVPHFMYIKDVEGKYIIANKALSDVAGVLPQKFKGMSDYDFCSEEMANNFRENELRIINSGKPIENIYEISKDASGNEIAVLATKVPLKNPNGQVERIVGVNLNISEQIRLYFMEKKLEQEKNQLRTLIDNIPDFVYIKDTDSKFVVANKALARVAKMATEELIGKTDQDYYPIAMANKFRKDEVRIIETGESLINMDEKALDGNGNEITILTTKVPLKDAKGKVYRIIGISRDITILRQIENEIQHLFNIAMPILEIDVNYNVLRANQAFCKLFKFDKKDVESIKCYDLWKQNCDGKSNCKLKYIITNQKPSRVVTERNTKDGKTINCIIDGIPNIGINGKVNSALFCYTDIRDRIKAEKDRDQERNRLRTLIDTIPDHIYFKDTKARFVDVNLALAKSLQKKPVDLIGVSDAEVYPADMAEQFFKDDMEIIHSKKPINKIEQSFDEKGNKKPSLTSKVPLFDEKGKVIGLVGIGKDISELKQKEKELEQAIEAKNKFLANISHDIRTPLTTVLGNTDLLINDIKDNRNRYYLEGIKSSSKTLLGLIDDILDISRLEMDKITLSEDTVGLRDLLAQIKHAFRLKVKEKGLEYKTKIPPTVPHYIRIDESKLRQLLWNLVGNAIKFSDKGSITVFVDCLDKKTDNFTLLIRVEDTGRGIPEDKMDIIFRPFEQYNLKKQEKIEGTGLGLSIVKGIVEKMGGEIKVQSDLNKGSIFEVLIPSVKIVTKNSCEKDTFDPSTIKFKKACLLIADDEDSIHNVIGGYFGGTDIQLIKAKNGQEACEAAKEHQPDLILMDIRMPKMDGIQATRKIKKDIGLRKIPIIAFTASVSRMEVIKEKHPNLFKEVLFKPIERSRLFKELTPYLEYETINKKPGSKDEHFIPGGDNDEAINKKFEPKDENFIFEGVDDETLNKMVKIKDIIKEKYDNYLQSMENTDDKREFAENIKEIGEKHSIDKLAGFGKEILNTLKPYNYIRVEYLLGYFKVLINKITNLEN